MESTTLTPSDGRTLVYSSGRERLARDIHRAITEALAPRVKLTGSQWTEKYGIIPPGAGSSPGPIRLYGYQKGMVDAFVDPRFPKKTVLKSAQVGYSLMLGMATAHQIDQEASTTAFIQPTKDDAVDYGAGELFPILHSVPQVDKLFRSPKRGEKQDTVTDVILRNGSVIRLRGAASDDSFRRYKARFQSADELDADGWNPKTNGDGDKLDLLWMRGQDYWDRIQIRGGTPKFMQTSRVWREWQKSDQSYYFVPCPHCGGEQYLEWTDRETPYGLKWTYSEKEGELQDAFYVCKHCQTPIDESQKRWMDARGEWRPTNPNCEPGHKGFYVWSGMSMQPNSSWKNIVYAWLDACKDPMEKVQTFINLWIGKPFEPTFGQEIKLEQFVNRLEHYPFEVPRGVEYLVSSTDVQTGKNPRLETAVYGVGAGMEQWLIGRFIHRGDTAQQEVWEELDELLLRSFKGENGQQFFVQASVVDSGDGSRSEEVRLFCRDRMARRVWAIKGKSESRGQRGGVWPRKPSSKNGSVWYMIGGNRARDYAYGSLAVVEPGPRYVHFPSNPCEGSLPFDEDYFRQLTAEKLITRKAGYTEWTKPRTAHEAGVLHVYAYAAICGLQSSSRKWVDATDHKKIAEKPVEEPKSQEKKRIEEPRNHIQHIQPPKRKSDWLNGRGKNWLRR